MENKTNSKAVASLVLGIFSCAFWSIPYLGWAALPAAIVGLVLSVMAKKEIPAGEPTGIATAGLVLSIIGLARYGINFLACIACAGGAFTFFDMLS